MNGPRAQTGSPFVPGTLVGGKYRLIKQIGEGAMGVVWSAVNEGTSGEIALKLIWKPEPEYRVRLLREAKACGNVRHKNVIQIHDVGQTDGGDPFLVMELLSGGTLAELLERKRRLPPAEAAAIGRDIARGLAAAHAKNIVHRDLKPANIFLHNEPGEDAPVVKVLDFGVAKNLSVNDGLRTAAGGTVGSPVYMSPEQARSERDIDERADIWSLGVVLFEMLTGERPFRGELAEVLFQIQEGEIPTVARRMRRIDPELDAIVTACLTRRRDDRLGPALEVARLLDEHAGPTGRDPLPSLLEESPLDRISGGGPSSISGGSGMSQGPAPTALSPSSIPALRPSSSGHGQTGFVPAPAPSVAGPGRDMAFGGGGPGRGPVGGLHQSSSYGRTEPISSPSFPRPLGAPQVISEDDAATHRLDPRMLAPVSGRAPVESSHGPSGPSGTVRIDPNAVEQAIAARGVVPPPALGVPTAPPPPPSFAVPAAPPAASFGAPVVPPPAPAKDTLVLPVAGATSSTAPMLGPDVASGQPPVPQRGSRRALWVVLGAVLGSAALAAVVFFVVFGKKPPVEPEATTPPAATATATATALPTAAPSPAEPPPVPSATATATATAEMEPPVPSATATATATPAPTPKLTGRLPKPPPPPPPPCKSKYGIGAGCKKAEPGNL